jgi:hypothetical protein
MNVHDPRSGASQRRKQGLLKGWIPVQNAIGWRIRGVQAGILSGELGCEPLRAVLWECTIDDVRDSSFIDEPGRQKRTRPNEDPRVEVRRRLTKVVRDGDEHCLDWGLRF